MEEGLIGVIVPVYKVEKYIAECIESILAQTYTNFRLILVDDGTPDNAGKICDEYAKKDPRITVIHQENAGVTRARARGVEEADDCEFITFVDSDDTLPIESLAILIRYCSKDTNIVHGDFKNNGYLKTHYTPEEYINGLISLNDNFIQAPWGKLFRKSLFDNNVFKIPKEILIGEDTIMNVRLAINNNSDIVCINQIIYNYRIRANSISQSFKDNLNYQCTFYKYLQESIPENKLHLYTESIVRRKVWNWTIVYQNTSRKPLDSEMEFIKSLKTDIKKYRFKLNLLDKIQLYSNSKIIRGITIKMRRAINKFKN